MSKVNWFVLQSLLNGHTMSMSGLIIGKDCEPIKLPKEFKFSNIPRSVINSLIEKKYIYYNGCGIYLITEEGKYVHSKAKQINGIVIKEKMPDFYCKDLGYIE